MTAYTVLPRRNSCQITPRPFICFINLEGIRELSTWGQKDGCNFWTPHTEELKIIFFILLASLLSLHQLLSLLQSVFIASTHAVAGKARHSFVFEGTMGCGQQPRSRSCPLLRQLPCRFTDLWAFLFISSFCYPHTHRRVMNWQWQVKWKLEDWICMTLSNCAFVHSRCSERMNFSLWDLTLGSGFLCFCFYSVGIRLLQYPHKHNCALPVLPSLSPQPHLDIVHPFSVELLTKVPYHE